MVKRNLLTDTSQKITVTIYKVKTRRPTLYVLVVKCGLEAALQRFCIAVNYIVSGFIVSVGIPYVFHAIMEMVCFANVHDRLKGIFGRLIGLKFKLLEGLFGWHF